MQSPTDHNENANTTKKPPANAVYRSRIEICRILNVLVLEKCQVFAEIGPERLLATKILLVDEDSEYMVMEYGANKWNNSQLFDHPSLRYNASYLGAYLFFQLSKPSEYLLDHNPAIRFALPDSLLCSQRREFQRINVPPHVPLHCVYKNEKGDFFRANVYDISLDGMGGIVFDENVPLQIGQVLKGCRITCPGFEPIVVDLVARNIMNVVRADGTIYKRAGVRFIQRPDEIQLLINFFIQSIGN